MEAVAEMSTTRVTLPRHLTKLNHITLTTTATQNMLSQDTTLDKETMAIMNKLMMITRILHQQQHHHHPCSNLVKPAFRILTTTVATNFKHRKK